jgi:ABC-type bacteriocin/lantibiotic exporter with double-glycine peptidase domain
MTTPTRNAFEEARDWNRLVPGSAAEMRAEYSAQLKHKQRIETAQMVFQYFGPFLGAGVIVTALSMGVWLITNGHTTDGGLIATIDLVGFFLVLFAYFIGRRSR